MGSEQSSSSAGTAGNGDLFACGERGCSVRDSKAHAQEDRLRSFMARMDEKVASKKKKKKKNTAVTVSTKKGAVITVFAPGAAHVPSTPPPQREPERRPRRRSSANDVRSASGETKKGGKARRHSARFSGKKVIGVVDASLRDQLDAVMEPPPTPPMEKLLNRIGQSSDARALTQDLAGKLSLAQTGGVGESDKE